MDGLYELKDVLMQELADYSSKEMNASSLDIVDKLAHTVKNLCKIMDYESSMGYGYRRGNNSRRTRFE